MYVYVSERGSPEDPSQSVMLEAWCRQGTRGQTGDRGQDRAGQEVGKLA
jgi:hypothetical protein